MTTLANHLTDLPGYWKRTYEKDLKRITLLVVLEALGLSKELMISGQLLIKPTNWKQ